MKKYIASTLSLILVIATQSANAAEKIQLTWDQPTQGDAVTEEFLLSLPQVGAYNLANTQESLDAYCQQVFPEAKLRLKMLGLKRNYKGIALKKSGPTISAGAYVENAWTKVNNSEIVEVIICVPSK